MPYYNHAWHLFSESQRRAFGEAQRKALSQKWHAKWISRAGLKSRMWTDSAITKFLGEPVDAGPIKAWSCEAMIEAEKNPSFVTWMARRRARLQQQGLEIPEWE